MVGNKIQSVYYFAINSRKKIKRKNVPSHSEKQPSVDRVSIKAASDPSPASDNKRRTSRHRGAVKRFVITIFFQWHAIYFFIERVTHSPWPPRSEQEQRLCISCKASTEHTVCTHWVACNDYSKPKKAAQFKIYICSQCQTECSPCRKCSQKTKGVASVCKLYMWIKNEAAPTKYSLRCDTCKQQYVRCNYCKVHSERDSSLNRHDSSLNRQNHCKHCWCFGAVVVQEIWRP